MVDFLILYFPYLGILLLLILGGIGLPFPEDLTLVLAGQIALSENLNLPILVLICFGGVITADLFLFHAGKKYGRRVITRRFVRRIYTPKRRVQVKKGFHKMGDWVVFVARFVGGFRAPVFIMAGVLKMSYPRFLLLDFCAAILSVPLFVLGSYYLGQKFREWTHNFTIFLIILMGFFFLYVAARWVYESWKNHPVKRHR
jgi:membrane protein DedA with SNARE-associated domain